MKINNKKNRERENFTFANINLLGPCNMDCYFCLGKDLPTLAEYNHLNVHYTDWPHLFDFLEICEEHSVRKLYITGLTTDSLCYIYLDSLMDCLHRNGFEIGLRTNGHLALKKMATINRCDLSVGYTVHSLNPVVHKMITGRKEIPNWGEILTKTTAPLRVQLVVNRCNAYEFWQTLQFVCKFPKVKYIQVRRISSDTRTQLLIPDMVAYEQLYTQANQIFPIKQRLWQDAEVYEIYGKDVVFWRTIKTSVNSLNYFTDGVISEEYFIIEGYLRNK